MMRLGMKAAVGAIAAAAIAAPALAADVNVQMNNVEASGFVYVSLCTEDEWFERGGPNCALSQRVDVSGGTTRFTFPNVASGAYALSGYHDVDGDGALGTNVLGIPNEPLLASNNARGRFGPPSFDDMKVNKVDGQDLDLSVTLYRY